jgi:hypothetical protein
MTAAYLMNSRSSWKGCAAMIIAGIELAFVCNALTWTFLGKIACLYIILSFQESLRLPPIDAYILTIIAEASINLLTLEDKLLDGCSADADLTGPFDVADPLNATSQPLLLTHVVQDIPTSGSPMHSVFHVCSIVCLKIVSCGFIYMLMMPATWKFLTILNDSARLPENMLLILQLALLSGSLLVLRSVMYFVLHMDPLIWIFSIIVTDNFRRLYVCGYWIGCLSMSIPLTNYLSHHKYPNICIRKVFHFLAAAMFNLPLLDPDLLSFICVAMGVAMCVLLLIEGCRSPSCSRLREVVPGINDILSYFQLFVDKRDSNRPIVLSHIYLLLACAVPVWLWGLLHICHQENSQYGDLLHEFVQSYPLMSLIPHVGYVTVGLGDAAVRATRTNIFGY